jgi:hypothetical protein
MKQIKRFREGGSEYPLVLRLALNWYVPRMREFAKIVIPANTGKIMDSYRPLENEQAAIEDYADDLKVFLRKAKVTDSNLNSKEAINEDIFEIYLND